MNWSVQWLEKMKKLVYESLSYSSENEQEEEEKKEELIVHWSWGRKWF